jgi:hypothetical protein
VPISSLNLVPVLQHSGRHTAVLAEPYCIKEGDEMQSQPITEFFAWLAQDRAHPLDLSAVEQSELERLAQDPDRNLPYLSRICDLLGGNPLIRERSSFSELMRLMRQRLDMPNLAARLEQVADELGGLLDPEEVQVQRALKERPQSTTH